MTDSESILRTLVQAAEAKTQKEKIQILKNAESATLKEYLHLVLDPQHSFYMTHSALLSYSSANMVFVFYRDDIRNMLTTLQLLANRTLTGADAFASMAVYEQYSDAATRILLKYTLDRQLPGKIGEKIVNAAFPGLIYHQPYGGVSSWDPNRAEKFNWDKGVLVQEKIDGMALFLTKSAGTFTIHTRQGQDVTDSMIDNFRPLFLAMPEDHVIHVEVELLGYGDSLESNGVFNSVFQGTRTLSAGDMLVTVLDVITFDGFYKGLDKTPALTRLNKVENIVVNADVLFPTTSTVHNLDAALVKARIYIAHGGEGAVIKEIDSPWKDTRMRWQMKIKNQFDCTLRVVGWVPHSKHKDWVGSLLCESLESSDKKIKTRVGSGLNEDQASTLCRIPPACGSGDAWIGQLVEVRAECISKHNALKHPRILHIRYDKDQPDTYDEVLGAYETAKAGKVA